MVAVTVLRLVDKMVCLMVAWTDFLKVALRDSMKAAAKVLKSVVVKASTKAELKAVERVA